MERITGLSDEQVRLYELRIEGIIRVQLQMVMDRIADRIATIQTASALVLVAAEQPPASSVPAGDGLPPGQPYVSPDDLASISPMWQQAVTEAIMPVAAEVFMSAAGAVHAQMVDATGMTFPSVGSLAAEQYLAGARNTFDDIGNNLWETARNELLDGFERGESIPQLAERLRSSAGMTAKSATLVGRTKVIEASNAGSIATARASGLEMVKEWIATPDPRTRPTHLAADGQRVPLNEKFTVGGFQADFPADPSLPPAEAYSCRCTVGYLMAERTIKKAQDDIRSEPVVQLAPGERASSGAVGVRRTLLAEPGPDVVDADLVGVNGLSSDLAVREVQIENRIRQAYRPGPTGWASLADIRDGVGGDVSRAEVDAALKRLDRRPDSFLAPENDQTSLTQRKRDASLALGGQAQHILKIEDARLAPLPRAAPLQRLPGTDVDLGELVEASTIVRPVLARAKTERELQQAWRAEFQRIAGRDVLIQMPPNASLKTMGQYAEGTLQALERFPEAKIGEISWWSEVGGAYARVTPGGRYGAQLQFNAYWSAQDNRAKLLRAMRGDTSGWDQGRNGWSVRGGSTPTTTAYHEFAHVLDLENLGERVGPQALAAVRRNAIREGIDEDTLVSRDISIYAGSDVNEMIAEAFTDVMVNGRNASLISREIYDLMALEYRRGGFGIRSAPVDELAEEAARFRRLPGDDDDEFVGDIDEGEHGYGRDPTGLSYTEFDVDDMHQPKFSAAYREEYGPLGMDNVYGDTAVAIGQKRGIHIGDDSAGRMNRRVIQDLTPAQSREAGEAIWTVYRGMLNETRTKTGIAIRAISDDPRRDGVEITWSDGTVKRYDGEAGNDEAFGLQEALDIEGTEASVRRFARAASPQSRLASMTVAQLRALAVERRIAVPTGARKADLVRLLDEGDVPSMAPAVGIPKYVPPKSLTVGEQERATKLVNADPQIFATVQKRFGDISTSGNLNRDEEVWLQALFEREPAFVNHLAQTAQIRRTIAREAKKRDMTPTEYKRSVEEKLDTLLAGKPIAVRVRDEAALRDILSGGRFKTQFEPGVKRAPGLTGGVDNRRFGEEILGIPADTLAAERPIYGYVAVRGVEPALSAGRRDPYVREREGQEDILSAYGRVQVVLKPSVRDRTTATVGDSLDELGFIRPSPINKIRAESVARDLDAPYGPLLDPTWTRRSYVEAQIHGGVRVEDIAEVVFPDAPSAVTAKALDDAGIRWRVMRKGDEPFFPAAAPVAPAAAAKPVASATSKLTITALRKLAKERGIDVPAGIRKGDLVKLIDEAPERAPTFGGGAIGLDAMKLAPARVVRGDLKIRGARLSPTDRRDLGEELLQYQGGRFEDINDWLAGTPGRRRMRKLDESDLAAMRIDVEARIAHIDRVMDQSRLEGDAVVWRGLRADDPRFDRADLAGLEFDELSYLSTTVDEARAFKFAARDGEAPGVLMRMIAPRGTGAIDMSEVEGELLLQRGLRLRVVRDHGIGPEGVRRIDVEVVPSTTPTLTPAQIQRAAARARNAQIEAAQGTARLLAEVDEVLAKGANRTALRQTLDDALIAPEQLFAGADPAVLDALRGALATGDMAKLKAAVTRLGTKAKIKVIGGRAGAKAKYDPDTMDLPPGVDEPALGAPVTVLRRGATVIMDDGEVITLDKARVVPVGAKPKPVKPTKPAVPSRDAPTYQEITGAIKDWDSLDQAGQDELYQQIYDMGRSVVDGDFNGITVRLKPIYDGGVTVSSEFLGINGDLLSAQGRKIGTFYRTISPDRQSGELVAHHSYLHIGRTHQGSGFAEVFNNNLYQWYRRSGVKRVEITANEDVGGYAWATKGFEFEDSTAVDEWLERARESLDKALKRPPKGITTEQVRELDAYVRDIADGKVKARTLDIARFGRQPGQGGKAAMWPGKWLMMKNYWRGVLDL